MNATKPTSVFSLDGLNLPEIQQQLGTLDIRSFLSYVVRSLPLAFLSLLLIFLIQGTIGAVRHRLSFKAVNKGLKHAPHSLWFGTFPAMIELFKTAPHDAYPTGHNTLLQRKHGLGGLFVNDLWPGTDDLHFVIADADLAAQATTQGVTLEKHHSYAAHISHVTGEKSMLFTEGAEWRHQRSMFNPGFALSHLMKLVPGIVEETEILVKVLGKLADKGTLQPLEEPLACVTIDIMSNIILAHKMNSQTSKNEMVEAFRNQSTWTLHPSARPWMRWYNPVMRYVHWRNTSIMDNYIRRVIQERASLRQQSHTLSKKDAARRPAIDLAMDEFYASSSKTADKKAQREFEQVAIDQMKTFLFAGHDTSSSTLCFIYMLLDHHPEVMRKTREEHERVFGKLGETAEKMKSNPQLLNEMPYTTAVIKETLRLYSPASAARQGQKGFSLQYEGVSYPTNGQMVWISHHTIHRQPHLFPEPDSFIPERFLTGEDMWKPQGEIKKDSWRPFEKGPRACIGIELAMLDMKVIMALTVRGFDFKCDWAEWDRLKGRKNPGGDEEGRRSMFGHRFYQQMVVAAKPVDGMPARVLRRNVESEFDQ